MHPLFHAGTKTSYGVGVVTLLNLYPDGKSEGSRMKFKYGVQG